MEKILISVVIPTYKRPQLLARCLAALSKQSLHKAAYEIIVVSDGPDHESLEIADRYLSEVCKYQVLMLASKKGPAAARNLGWQHASGKLIAFTDDDCLPEKDWLENLAGNYHNEELIAFTGAINVPVQYPLTDFAKNTANLETAEFVTANCCVTKDALLLTGGFDERFLMAWREDSDLEFKLLSENIAIKRIHDAVVVHPVREAEWGVSIKEQHKGMFNALLYKKFPSLYRQKIQGSPPWNYYLIIASFIGILAGLIIHNTSVTMISLFIWFLFTTLFITRRLKDTSLMGSHVFEMIVTSMAIPFLSVYWQLYGSIKYRVLFL